MFDRTRYGFSTKPLKNRPMIADLYGTHSGATMYVLGSSGSLHNFPFKVLRDKLVIGPNDMLLTAPLDYHFFHDIHLYDRYKDVQPSDRLRAIVSMSRSVRAFEYAGSSFLDRLYQVRRSRHTTLHLAKKGDYWSNILFCYRTVAVSGIELAYKLGASTIYMLGIDACCPPNAPYYVHGGASRKARFRMTVDKSARALQKYAESTCLPVGDWQATIQRIYRDRLQLETRHLKWYDTFGMLKRGMDLLATPPRVVNLSPCSIIDHFGLEDPWQHFGITRKQWLVGKGA